MNADQFRRHGHEIIDWIADYLTHTEGRPVSQPVEPGSIRAALPTAAPEQPEPMEAVWADFQRVILPGLVHWNHPNFFGFFPANNSFPSILASLLAAGMGVNGMNWATSPAVTELEQTVVAWMRAACDLPEHFEGCIQDGASTGVMCALLGARERATGWAANRDGLTAWDQRLLVYASAEAHSSVEKAAKIVGLGQANFRPVPTDRDFAQDPAALDSIIQADLDQGGQPIAVVATVGTTSSTGLDPLEPIGRIAGEYGLWMHVDAALAGPAALLPEMRYMFKGLEMADSYSFNPHKWLLTNYPCSLFYVADPAALTRIFAITPEYLKSAQDSQVTNFRDWGPALGRPFRALKLWFVLRTLGLDGLREMLRQHLAWTRRLAELVEAEDDFDLLAPAPLQTVCLRFHPAGAGEAELDELNSRLIQTLNQSGRVLLTQTRLAGRVALRVSLGQANQRWEHVEKCWDLIRETARRLIP